MQSVMVLLNSGLLVSTYVVQGPSSFNFQKCLLIVLAKGCILIVSLCCPNVVVWNH